MVSDHNSTTGETLLIMIHALSEIKDALRELRDTVPDSVLVSLAEQKIERIERNYDTGEDLEGA
jgi:hypothetical protein